MQEKYSKLEYEATRNMWLQSQRRMRNADGDDDMSGRSFEEQFSTLVEQEVERRIFQVGFKAFKSCSYEFKPR